LPGLKTVIIFRNPLEVAYSMHKRNATSYALGLRLWEIYNRRLLADTDPDERIITYYQAFFEDPEAELQKIAAFAGLNANAISAAAALVAVNRRHTTFTIEQMIDAGVSGQIVALYRSLIDGTTQRSKGTKKNKRTSAAEDDRLSGTENKLKTSIPDGEDVRRDALLCGRVVCRIGAVQDVTLGGFAEAAVLRSAHPDDRPHCED
jgi:hypothetical protein